MRKKVNQIRDVNIIEEELKSFKAGILAYNDANEKVNQLVTSFLYENKNIYLVFDENDEAYESIKTDTTVSFSAFRQASSAEENNAGYAYKYFSVRFSGIVKKSEDAKLLEDLARSYGLKYYGNTPSETDLDMSGKRVIILDTEEIQASEITGGF